MTVRRRPAEIARDRKRIGELYLRGWLQVDIAAEIERDQSTVSRDLKTLHEEWKASALCDYDEAKGRELARIDALELVYWEEWERSKQEMQTTVTERTAGDGDKAPRDKARVRKEERLGDPRYLAGVQWCIVKRCNLFGLDAPVKSDITSDGKPIAAGPIILPAVIEIPEDNSE